MTSKCLVKEKKNIILNGRTFSCTAGRATFLNATWKRVCNKYNIVCDQETCKTDLDRPPRQKVRVLGQPQCSRVISLARGATRVNILYISKGEIQTHIMCIYMCTCYAATVVFSMRILYIYALFAYHDAHCTQYFLSALYNCK